MSTFETEPVLNIGLIAYAPTPNGIARLLDHRNVHLLCTFKRDALPPRKPDAWHNTRSDTPRNTSRLALVVVSNVAGETLYSHPARLDTLKNAMEKQGIFPDDWTASITRHSTLNDGDIITKGYRRASTAPPAQDLNHIVEPLDRGQPLKMWRAALKCYCTQPAKHFPSPKSIIYTDASKSGTSVAAAVHQASTGLNHSFKVLGHDASLNTALHGELAGIHRALTLLNEPQHHGPQVLLTDSLSSIWLIRRALSSPQFLRVHKNRCILLEIAHMLASRTAAIHIYKVRAHTGIVGNIAVDKLAKLAHDLPPDPATDFTAAGATGRSAHWIQYASDGSGSPALDQHGPPFRDVDTLKDHVLRIAQAQHTHKLMTPKKPSSVLIKNIALLKEHEGIDTDATRSIWNSVRAPDLKIAIRIRLNRLHTAARQKLHTPDKTPDATCTKCGAAIEDADHALNKCTQPQSIQMYKERHDHVGILLTRAIKAGERGSHYMHTDLCTVQQIQGGEQEDTPSVQATRKCPDWVIPRRKQTSCPDILLIDILERDIVNRKGKMCTTTAQRGQHTIDIIEIKYKYDLEINKIVPDALAQHADLTRNLLTHGWKAVHVHPFIVGSAGTISQSLHTILVQCGISTLETRQKLLHKIAADSVTRTAEIVRLRGTHTPPPPAQAPSSRETPGAPSHGSDRRPTATQMNPSQAAPAPLPVPHDSPASPPQPPQTACTTAPQSTQSAGLASHGDTDHPTTLRRGARKRTPSVLLQDPRDYSPPLTRQRMAAHTPQQDGVRLGSTQP